MVPLKNCEGEDIKREHISVIRPLLWEDCQRAAVTVPLVPLRPPICAHVPAGSLGNFLVN